MWGARLLFGFGTGIPVIVFAVMIAFGMRYIEAVFIVAGIYYAAVYIFEVL